MGMFMGTVIIVSICCLAMSLSLLFAGKPFRKGCGSKLPGKSRCETCPKRDQYKPDSKDAKGESL